MSNATTSPAAPRTRIDLSNFATRDGVLAELSPLDAPEYTGPTADHGYTPTDAQEAYWSGFTTGLAGDPFALPIGHDDASETYRAWKAGHAEGFVAYEEESLAGLVAEWELEREADAFGDPADRIHEAESVRCLDRSIYA